MKTLRFWLICALLTRPAWAAENAAPPADPGEEVQFRIAVQPGDTLRMKIVTRTFGSMNLFGSMLTQKFSQQFEQEVFTRCIEVKPDKSSVHELTLPNVAMRMNMGGMKIEVDTRHPNPAASQPFDTLERVFAAMTRIRCKVTVSAEGEPLKVEGLSQGMQAAMDEIGDQLMPGMKQFFDQFRDYLADDILAEQMRSSFRMFPDGGKARVGDTWKREWQIKLPPFNVLTRGHGEYQLLGVEEFRGRKCARIQVKSSLTTIPGQKPDLSSLSKGQKGVFDRMQFSMDSSGGNGLAYIDLSNGDLLQLRETQRNSIELSMEPDPNAPAGEIKEGLGKITQKLTTSIQIDLLEKNGKALAGNVEAREQQPEPPAGKLEAGNER